MSKVTFFKNAKVPAVLLPETLRNSFDYDALLDPAIPCDLEIDACGVIAAVGRAGEFVAAEASEVCDLEGSLVLPGFVDAHVHLDKAHLWPRGPNPRGEFWDAIEAIQQCRTSWSEADVFKRADFTLQSAWAYGSSAVRTHVDTDPEFGEMSHRAMAELKAHWAGKVTLQTVALTRLEEYSDRRGVAMAQDVKNWGCDLLGGFPVMSADLDRELDVLFAVARDLEMGLDLHVDENGDASTECLKHIAQAVLRHEFPYSVTCGHCCSLSLQEPARQAETIARVKEAGVNIISLPLCNLYLQGRRWSEPDMKGHAKTPNWRGVTQLHEFMEAGVTVACASDNVRDAFYAYGDLDMFEVYMQSVRIAHLDTRLAESVQMVTAGPASIMGLEQLGRIEPGCLGDLVVFPARNFSELLSRPYARRRVIRRGAFCEAELPDYASLPS